MANAPQPARRNARRNAVLAGIVAAPLAVLAISGAAQAAELTPVAEYLDQNVADTEAEVGAVLDDLGLKAAE